MFHEKKKNKQNKTITKNKNSSNNVWYDSFQWIFKILKEYEKSSESVNKTSYNEKESANPLQLGNWNMSKLISWYIREKKNTHKKKNPKKKKQKKKTQHPSVQ